MRTYGFTFLELLVTLAVASVLLMVGIPGLQYLLADSALQTEGFTLHHALHRARSQAIDQQTDVIACLADKQEQCVKQNFTHLLLFNDGDQDRKLSAHHADDIILLRHPLSGTVLNITTNQLRFIFQPDGTLAGTPGTIRLCSPQINEGTDITIAMSGRVRRQAIRCPESQD